LGSEGAETEAVVGAGSTLSVAGTAEATGAGEAVGPLPLIGIGKLPAQPVAVKIKINVAMVQPERNKLRCFILFLLYLT
jgi:hypothetical protein